MQEYKQIDKDGYVIETYLPSDTEEIPYDWKPSWGYGKSFYDPKWNFDLNQWEEGRDNKLLLDERKNQKKTELNKLCQDSILKGFCYNFYDSIYHFSYDSEAQKNMSDRWNLFQNDMIESIKVTAHNEDGSDVRLAFNKDEFNGLYLTSVQHKEHCISKYRDDLLPLVKQAMTIEQVEAITWDTVVVEPVPSLVVIEDDNTLDKQVEEMKISQAEGDMGILSLLSMMGVLG